jgi:hypothetical protein
VDGRQGILVRASRQLSTPRRKRDGVATRLSPDVRGGLRRAAALFVTVVGLNFVGDAVRDALDPRMRG